MYFTVNYHKHASQSIGVVENDLGLDLMGFLSAGLFFGQGNGYLCWVKLGLLFHLILDRFYVAVVIDVNELILVN